MKSKLFFLLALLVAANPALSTAFPNKVVDMKLGAREMIRFAHEKIHNPTYEDRALLDKAVTTGGKLITCLGFSGAMAGIIAMSYVPSTKDLDIDVIKICALGFASYAFWTTCLRANAKIDALRTIYDLPPALPVVAKA